MALTYPHSFTTGATIDASQVNANFEAVKTYLDTTKLSAQNNLSTPYSLVPFTFTIPGAFAGGATNTFYVKVPTGVALRPISAQVAIRAVAAGTPVVTLQATVGGSNVLTSACSTSAAATPDEEIAFDITSVAAGSVIAVTITNTAGGGNTATDVTGALICKAFLL